MTHFKCLTYKHKASSTIQRALAQLSFMHTILAMTTAPQHLGYALLFCLLFQACVTPITIGTPTQAATPEQVAELTYNLTSNTTFDLQPNLIYYLDETLVIQNLDSYTLNGNGSTIIQRNPNADVIRIEGGNKVTLKNFKATHTEPSGPLGCTGSVIQVYNSSNATINNCHLNGSGIIGVVAYDASNLNVTSSYIYNNSQYGILYQGSTSISITNNRFDDNGVTGSAHVAKALNAFLSEIDMMSGDENKAGATMSGNKYE